MTTILENTPGIFFSVEGPEFSGKSTVINKFKEIFPNLDIMITKEPGATSRGKILREWVTNPTGAFETNQNLRAMGFAMDRAIHIHELIVPALNDGKIVITDRYIDSSYVLQGLIQKIPLDEINFCNCYANEVTSINDILPFKTIYIDINEETAIERSKMRGNENLMDVEFMKRFNDVREAYLELARKNPNRYIVIDGSGSKEEVQEKFNNTILEVIKNHRSELMKPLS